VGLWGRKEVTAGVIKQEREVSLVLKTFYFEFLFEIRLEKKKF
jgi:hypothetical protein